MFRKSVLLARNLMQARTPCMVRSYSLYEPDYLDVRNLFRIAIVYPYQSVSTPPQLMKPKYPIYETINIQIKGYDYSILENYQKFIHRMAESMDLDIADG